MAPLDVLKGSNYGCVTGELLGDSQLPMQPQTSWRGATMNRKVQRGIWFVPAIPLAFVGFVVLVLVLVAIVVAGVVVWYYTRPQDHRVPIPADACPCETEKDRQDMEKRVAEAEAAVKKINEDLAPKGSGSKPFSGTEKEGSLPQLQEAIGGESVKKTGGTRPSCITWVDRTAPVCIQWSYQTHENVHAHACDQYINGGGKGDWKQAGTMEKYWREDAGAYQAEVDFLKGKLAKCPQQVSDYIGTETKEEQQQRHAGSKRRVAKSVGAPI